MQLYVVWARNQFWKWPINMCHKSDI